MLKKVKERFRNFIVASVRSSFVNEIKKQNDELLLRTQRLLAISNLHQKTFASFKNCYNERSVVIVGAGPSLNAFKPIDDCIYIGLNSAVLYTKVKYDYLFAIDKVGLLKSQEEFSDYDCIKFIGDQNLGAAWQIPESEIVKMKGTVLRYKTDTRLYMQSKFALDIETEPIGNFNTVSIQALQFALYTNPRKIYLVGIDCSALGHFGKHDTLEEVSCQLSERGEDLSEWARFTINAWKSAKEFASLYYPGTDIVSVNPIGLRGVFYDLDQ